MNQKNCPYFCRPLKNNGFTVLEFLIISVSFFSGLYFIFWASLFASNYMLAQHYLNDFSFCQLKSNSTNCIRECVNQCLHTLEKSLNSLLFIKIKNLDFQTIGQTKIVNLIFAYDLPMIGPSSKWSDIKISSSVDVGAWR